MLIAKRPILYGSVLYQPGDTLPAGDPRLMEAWVKAGSAEQDKGPDKPARKPADTKPNEGKTGKESPSNAGGEKYNADMKADVLKEEGKTYGLSFPFGTKKTDMADALNAAFAKKLADEAKAAADKAEAEKLAAESATNENAGGGGE